MREPATRGGNVLITVAGATGLDPVVGLLTDRPTALLEATQSQPGEPVLVLSPRHTARPAREQAHVLVAARPTTRVGVLVLDHHALTLLLTGRLVAGLAGAANGWAEPGAAVALVRQVAARSRSLVWYPRAAGRAGAWDGTPLPVGAGTRLRSLVGRPGYLAEVGATGLLPGRLGLDVGGGAGVLHSAGALPETAVRQLGDPGCAVVEAGPGPGCPYATPGSVELTLLAAPVHEAFTAAPCPVCGDGTGPSGCVFCSTAGVPAEPLATRTLPTRTLVPAGGSA